MNPLYTNIFTRIGFLTFLLFTQNIYAQFRVQTTVKESRCSANGQIIVKITEGGVAPFSFQLLGSARPIQTNDTFKLLPPAVYQVRITDANGANMTVSATILGNYQTPTTVCAVDYSNVTMTTTGGRPPFFYALTNSRTGNGNYSQPQSSNTFTCLSNDIYNFRVYDSCENFHTTVCEIKVKPLADTISCAQVNGKTNMTTSGFGGGIPPLLFTCISNYGDTFRNTTGNFSQLRGCNFTVILSDRCNILEKELTCTTLKGYVKCANFLDTSATVSADRIWYRILLK